MDEIESRVVDLISGVLSMSRPDIVVSPDSSMGDPVAWDSLAFVDIFMTVSSHFGLDVSDDDAINFVSVREIVMFVKANA